MPSKEIMRYLMTLVILCAGCQSTKPTMLDSFPKGLENICIQQLNTARTSLQIPLIKKRGAIVHLRKGEKRVSGMWCWAEGSWWIGGNTDSGGSPIYVGCNPVTLGEVSPGVLFHEFKHYWLITNGKGNGHDPHYFPEMKMSTNEVRL